MGYLCRIQESIHGLYRKPSAMPHASIGLFVDRRCFSARSLRLYRMVFFSWIDDLGLLLAGTRTKYRGMDAVLLCMPALSFATFAVWSLVKVAQFWWHVGREQVFAVMFATKFWLVLGWACLARWYGQWESLWLRSTMFFGGIVLIHLLVGIVNRWMLLALCQSNAIEAREVEH